MHRTSNFDAYIISYLVRSLLSQKHKMFRKQNQQYNSLKQQSRLLIVLLLPLLQKLIMLLTFSTCYLWMVQVKMAQRRHLLMMLGQVSNVCLCFPLLLGCFQWIMQAVVWCFCLLLWIKMCYLSFNMQLLKNHQQLRKLFHQNQSRAIASLIQDLKIYLKIHLC